MNSLQWVLSIKQIINDSGFFVLYLVFEIIYVFYIYNTSQFGLAIIQVQV